MNENPRRPSIVCFTTHCLYNNIIILSRLLNHPIHKMTLVAVLRRHCVITKMISVALPFIQA